MKKDYILTLEDDKEYALVNTLKMDDKNYVYLVDLHDYNNFIFGELIENKINKVTDNKLLSKLVMEFAKLKRED